MNQWRPSAPPPPGGWQPHHSSESASSARPQHAATPTRDPAAPRGGAQAWPPRRGIANPTHTDGQEPQAPEAFQSILMRARDQSRFEAPVIEEPRTRGPFPWKTVVTVFVFVLVLAVAGGAFYALVIRKPTVDPATVVKPSEGSSAMKIRTPQQVASEYLHALAAGDITAALQLGARNGDETSTMSLLSPSAHRAMRKKAPIEDIQILTKEPKTSKVDVSYKLAGQPIKTSFPVVMDERGSYVLERTTVTVVVELVQADALPLRVNGVEVPKLQPIEVVPGVYELSTDLPFIEYPQDNNFTIGSLQFADRTSLPATPRLTNAGADAFRSALQRSLDACVAMKQTSPKGCPQGVRPSKPIAEGSIKWSLVGNPMSQVEPSLSTDDLSIAVMSMDMTFNLTFRYADGSDPGTQTLKVNARASANMLGEKPDEITISWNR